MSGTPRSTGGDFAESFNERRGVSSERSSSRDNRNDERRTKESSSRGSARLGVVKTAGEAAANQSRSGASRARDRARSLLSKSKEQLYEALSKDDEEQRDPTPGRRRSFEFENLVRMKRGSSVVEEDSVLGWLGKYSAYIHVVVSGLVYFTGVVCLLVYANIVAVKSPNLGFAHTIMPAVLHITGIGATVVMKVYYDFSPSVGHLEKMHLIIRSRMWLYPGVFGKHKVKKRSILEAQRKVDIPAPHWDDEDERSGRLTFNMTQFLKRCQFAENRCLFRAWELYPWSQVARFTDLEYADNITRAAQEQIKRILPILDVLDGIGNVTRLLNPANYVRWTMKFGAFLVGKHPQTLSVDDIKLGSCATRAEEIEIDDVNPKAKDDYFQRDEPPPWGTVRLTDFRERFKLLTFKANALGFSFFALSISGYLVMIFGEVHFYSLLDIATRGFQNSGQDDESWSEEYSELHSVAFGSVLLMFMVLPFAVQSSALLAENAVVPVIVIDTLQAHVTNFTIELDQFLTVLAVNKGSLSSGVVLDHLETTVNPGSPGQSRGGSGRLKREMAQDLLRHKIAMTRDMALSWRIGKFIKEVEHDCEVINTSVGLMVLNFICHLVPLNIFVFNEDSCVPYWVIFFTAAQSMALISVIKGGVESNEMINEGIDSLLHNWQLKFNMIAWSGGFIQPGDDDEVVGFVSKDPPGETQSKIQQVIQQEGNEDYGAEVREHQRSRVDSIVRVLAHYEAENLTPFQVLGVTVTKDMLTLVIGFFGGSIVNLFTHVLDDRGNMRAVFMCHGLEYDG